MSSNKRFNEWIVLKLKFYSLFKLGKKELQACNKDWYFIHSLSNMQSGLCMTSRGCGGRVKKYGVNMESEGLVPYPIILHRNFTIFNILWYYK
jgi:hypothetical protein